MFGVFTPLRPCVSTTLPHPVTSTELTSTLLHSTLLRSISTSIFKKYKTMASSSKYFFANQALRTMMRVRQEERIELWRHDGMLAEWQTRDSAFLRDVIIRGTDTDLNFCALIEYYATYPRKTVAELPIDDRDCIVCKDPLTDSDQPARSERAVVLPCTHTIGERCLANWIWTFQGMSHTCPACRKEFWFRLDLPSPHERGYDSLDLLKLDWDTTPNAQSDDFYGRTMQLWDRILTLLRTIQSRVGELEEWIDKQPEERRESLKEHVADILVHFFHPVIPNENGKSEFRSDDRETIVVLDATSHIPFVDGGHPQQVVDSRRRQARELEERQAIDRPTPQQNYFNRLVDDLIADQELTFAMTEVMVEGLQRRRQEVIMSPPDSQDLLTQLSARQLERVPNTLRTIETLQRNAATIGREIRRIWGNNGVQQTRLAQIESQLETLRSSLAGLVVDESVEHNTS